MLKRLLPVIACICLAAPAVAAQAAAPTDPQIAHIAYTAGKIDIAAAKQALAKSHNAKVRAFANEMIRDHTAVNDKALALVKKLNVTPEDNPTSQALNAEAKAEQAKLAGLSGHAFDKAYIDNEVAFHRKVNATLQETLIPSAKNAELKSFLQSGLQLFREHEARAERIAKELH